MKIQEDFSFYTWLFLIVFIDVAHVYSTLFKTYFVKSEFQRRRKLYIGLPIVCFLIGLVLFSFGSKFFWSVLAYVAVFHFIRQQYGFVRLYARKEEKTKANRYSDALIIYTATLYPMLYWFFSSPRAFNWFVEKEFFQVENVLLTQIASVFYVIIIAYYIVRTTAIYLKTNYFNIPKNLIILGTLLSWYFGIVFFNNDFIEKIKGYKFAVFIHKNDEDKEELEISVQINKIDNPYQKENWEKNTKSRCSR